MRKFNPKSGSGNEHCGFYLDSDDSNYLFGFGGGCDIRTLKKNRNNGYCNINYTYDFRGEKLPLSDTTDCNKFTLKKITVIQME